MTKRLCVAVTGTNGFGSTTLGCSAKTNTIFPKQATQLSATTMTGSAYVGDTLVSGVGSWEYPGTTFTRQWESCNADGGSCATISNEKGAAYVIRAADLGQRLRVRISADSNGSNTFPAAVEVFTPLSAVVTTPPPPPADPTPTPTPAAAARRPRTRRPAPAPAPAPGQDRARAAVARRRLGQAQAGRGADAAHQPLRGRHAVGRPPARPRRPQAGQEGLQGRGQEGQEVHGRDENCHRERRRCGRLGNRGPAQAQARRR